MRRTQASKVFFQVVPRVVVQMGYLQAGDKLKAADGAALEWEGFVEDPSSLYRYVPASCHSQQLFLEKISPDSGSGYTEKR